MEIDLLFPDQNRHVRHLLGLYIQRKRMDAGLSSEDVARMLNMEPSSYRRVEAGRAKVSSEHFSIMTESLVLDPSELIEIRKISGVTYINDLSRVLSPNYPDDDE